MKNKIILFTASLFSFFSCQSQGAKEDFDEELVSLVVKYSDGNVSQIFIPFDSTQQFDENKIKTTQPILVEKLQKIGFKLIDSKFEGFAKECASVKVSLERENCKCTIFRVYEYTKLLDVYRIRENIDCQKKL